MGKNARRRKEAKLQEKLKQSPSGAGGCHHEGHCHHEHHHHGLDPLVEIAAAHSPVFRTDKHEPITEELVRELVDKQGWEEKGIRECKDAGMSYCRERNSFVSPPEAFGSFN